MPKSSKYQPQQVEEKWYQYWLDQGFFRSKPNPEKEPYAIVIPPPNVTGVLHMGHMLNNTIQDVLIRKARMEGKEACWVPGTDHASIATEAKVVAMLKAQGIEKNQVTREEFIAHAWEWTHKYGGIILEQLKKLGASCDWDRTAFTMNDQYYKDVIKVFVDLYHKGLIYRGIRMVNWDPVGQTALSDEEVNHREVQSSLYYVKYFLEGSEESITIATTRPETILGDTAVCINPNDTRYSHLKGKKVVVPLINRVVPVIQDEYVSMEFGTGCLKVTPAHDLNDYELGVKHNLASIDILSDDGTLNEKAQLYIGEDRFKARGLIVKDLEKSGQLIKVEDYLNNVGFSERTDAVIEPKLSLQWFMKMEELSKPALEHVLNGDIQFHPGKFINTYRHWMENIRDWCVSRQLWWGHRIPAYYLPDGTHVVAESAEEALAIAQENNPDLNLKDLIQDEDVLDTWASSWLWPIAVFDGISNPDNEEIKYYYPTKDLVTAPEILFFWVARMIIAGYQYLDTKPFEHVYLTGIVRDKQRRKMSKSLGNSPDPLELIAQYGADGVRTGMLFSSPAGNDLLFDEKLCEQGRNFSNKIWNALRLIKGWEVIQGDNQENHQATTWFKHRSNQAQAEIEDHFSKFRISDALMTLYKLVWDDFCSWYLEMVKPAYQQPIDGKTYQQTIEFFETLMKLLHPFMPFITEEVWHELGQRDDSDCIIIADWPQNNPFDPELLKQVNRIFEVISQIRHVRSQSQTPPRDSIGLYIRSGSENLYQSYKTAIKKLGNISELEICDSLPQVPGSGFVVRDDEFLLLTPQNSDPAQDKEQLEKELEYTKGFLSAVEKKLNNQRFVDNAPSQVVENEKKKKEDAEAKIRTLETSLAKL
ncbi:MAG: valine--tRNA ligase [Cyclobacteriaceae bacterium]|nr:MAG: valine--tRNA ligase [Cyclobacteriaceae bacterium]